MKIHLISGGCGFVGRNLVKRFFNTTDDRMVVIDNLLTGRHPSEWLQAPLLEQRGNLEVYGNPGRIFFIQEDFREILRNLSHNPRYLQELLGIDFERFSDVFHFSAVVGGRSVIDGDPMSVALDLSIDAELFSWVCRHKPGRLLYPSSSAAYPVDLQGESGAVCLKESDIDFNRMGKPDMTYGWSKLTGEYLAQIASQYYGIHVACIRPFSGYGEDQELSYPVPAIARRIARREDPVEVWGTGQQGRDFVHIDDVLDCMLAALDHIHDGSGVNISTGTLTSFLDVIHTLCDIAGYQPTIKPLTDKPVGVHNRYGDPTLSSALLGWKPKISLREGLERVYRRALERIEQESSAEVK